VFEDLRFNHPTKDQSAKDDVNLGYWSYHVKEKRWILSPEILTIFNLQLTDDLHQQGLFYGVLDDDRLMFETLFNQAIHDKKPFICRYRVRIHQEIHWFFINSRIDTYLDEVMAFYGTLQDITSKIVHELEHQSTIHQQKEEISSLKQEMREMKQNHLEVSQAKSSFFSAMSHEIRTPMNAMIGFTSLLEQTSLNEEQKEYVLRMKDASQHLLSIVNDILDLSKMEAGKLSIDHAPFRLSDLIHEIKSMMLDQAHRKHLYLDVETMNCPEIVIGDRLRIRQILINLIHNAIKFTETGGISVVFHFEEIQDETYLHVKVKDTGIGMTESQQQKLFGDYAQASSSTTRLYGGTGLGLSISQKLAHLMKGSITVTSKLNEGSQFTLSIPIEKDDTNDLEPEILHHHPRKGARILMAEDHLLSQKLSERMLRNLGMEITIVEHGALAVQQVKDHTYDLIFLDLHMPVMDGLQAAQTIRRFNTKTPIIALTANQFPEERSQSMLSGMNDLLTKPFDQDSLSRMLAKWLPEE